MDVEYDTSGKSYSTLEGFGSSFYVSMRNTRGIIESVIVESNEAGPWEGRRHV